MRRRVPVGAVPPQISVSTLRPCPTIDYSVPLAERVRVFNRWLADRASWVALREAHSEAFGWPGGDIARDQEERELRPVPDGPFDPTGI